MVVKQGHVTAYAVVLMAVIALSQQSEPKNNTENCTISGVENRRVITNQCIVYKCTKQIMDFDFIMLMWILQPSNSSTDTLVEPDTGDDVQIKGTTVNAIAMFHYNEGFTEVYSNLTLTPTQELNNMSVTCKLSDSDAETVILTVIGPPTQPQPILQLVNETTLLLEWSEPYSPPDHNITNYLLAINGTSGDALCPTDDTLCNISFSRDFNKYFIQSDKHPFRDYFEQSMCALLKFQVVAVSDIGCSQAGSAEGGFPMSATSINNDSMKYEVKFSRKHDELQSQVEVEISFTLPDGCPWQTATYNILLYVQESVGEPRRFGPWIHAYKDGKDIVETISNLTKDVEYYFAIEATVQEGLPPIISALRPFSTSIEPPLPTGSSIAIAEQLLPTGSSIVTTEQLLPTGISIVTTEQLLPTDTVRPSVLDWKLVVGVAIGGSAGITICLACVCIVIPCAVLLRRRYKVKSTLIQINRQIMQPNPMYEGYDSSPYETLDSVGGYRNPQICFEEPPYADLNPPPLPEKNIKQGANGTYMLSADGLLDCKKACSVDQLSTCSTGEEKYTEMNPVGTVAGQLQESECNIVPETDISSESSTDRYVITHTTEC